MDNKITKARISNFFSYEWILLIAIAVAGILIWELIYTMAGVRLTTGQEFKYYYDETVIGRQAQVLDDELGEAKTLSFDVLNRSYEALNDTMNVLSTRLSVQEGDAIFTDCEPDKKAEDLKENEYNTNRANDIIDGYNMYSYDKLVEDAENYLKGFLPAGSTDSALVYANLDQAKIKANFNKRLGRDNRFRTEAEKVKGIEMEKQRIEQLCEEVTFLKGILEYDKTLSADDSLFYSYKKYEQASNVQDDFDEKKYEDLMDKEPQRYGLKMEKLVGGKTIGNYVTTRKASTASAEYVVLIIFNFRTYQPDLQYETISFVNYLIRTFSNLAEQVA